MVIHKSFMLLTLAVFLGVMTLAGLNIMYDASLLATLSLLFYTLVPINPLPGYDLYSQNRKAWALILAIVGLLYIACLLQALSRSNLHSFAGNFLYLKEGHSCRNVKSNKIICKK